MSLWFRWYAGTTEDGKFRVTARNAGVTVRDVIAVWAFILEDASKDDHRGICHRNEDFIAAILDFEDGVVEKILSSMQEVNMISVGPTTISVCHWQERQFETDTKDNTNAERQKRYRERRRNTDSNGTVTAVKPPETEADTDTEAAQQTVSEFEKLDLVEAEVRSAAGEKAPDSADISPIVGLIEAGYDLVKDIVPVVRERAGRATKPIASWSYFVPAVEAAKAANGAIKPKANGTPSEAVTWLPVESPLWDAMAERWQHAKGKELRAAGSTHAPGRGAFIPSAWIEFARDLTGSVN